MAVPEPEKPKNFDFSGCRYLGIAAFIVFVAGVILAIPAIRIIFKNEPKTLAVRIRASQFAEALRQYRMEYGAFPDGDNARLLAVLRGDNARKIAFFEIDRKAVNAKGELLDQWGTPMRLDLSDPTYPRVWSCGRDRIDNAGVKGSDDIVSSLPGEPPPP